MSYTCPRCFMTSHNPHDEQEGYCGNCHDFTGPRGRVTWQPTEDVLRTMDWTTEHMGEFLSGDWANKSQPVPQNKMLTPGWNDVKNITTVKIFMKDGQEYSLTVEDPRIDIDDYLVPGRTVKTEEGHVINTDEIQRYHKSTTTTVIPNTIEGIENK